VAFPGDMCSSPSNDSSNILIKRKCEYVGSVKVPLLCGVQRQKYVNEKLMGLANVHHGIKIALVITRKGVKTMQKKTIKLAHSTSHILFSSYLSQNCLFAYVTKSYSPEELIEGQAYVYKVSHSYDLKLLNKRMKELLENPTNQRGLSCEEHYVFHNKKLSLKRNWAKVEHYQGHDLLDHAKLARERKSKIRINQFEKTDEDVSRSPTKITYHHSKNNTFDIQEYVIIDDQFVIENEFYCLESYNKWEPNHLEFTDEYYSLHEDKLHYEGSVLNTCDWLLEEGTSQQIIEKKLLMASIGSYLVVPQASPDSYLFTLRVPHTICFSGILSCDIQKSEEGFYLEGFTTHFFDSLLELVHYYGSVHGSIKLHGKDHTDSSSSDPYFAFEAAGLVFKTTEDIEDYECHESAQTLNKELRAFYNQNSPNNKRSQFT